MEYTKIKLRPMMSNFFTYAICSSSILLPLLAHFLAPLSTVVWSLDTFHLRVWRFCMLFNLIAGILAVIVMWYLPESAKFLLSIGDAEGAYKALNRLCLSNRKVKLESFNITSVTQSNIQPLVEKDSNFFKRLWNDTLPLFKHPYVKQYLIITCIICGYFFVGNGMSLYFVKIRNLLTDDDHILCDHVEGDQNSAGSSACSTNPIDYTDCILLGLSGFGTCIFITIMLLGFSRRSIMFVNAVLSAIGGFSLNFLKLKLPQLIATIIFITMCTSTISLAFSAIADMVPTHMRGKAIGLTIMFARLAVIIANSIIGHFVYDYCLIIFNLCVVVVIVFAILTLFLNV